MKTKSILTIIILILAITQGKTANISWVGSTSSAWNVSSNWSTSSVPDSADNVTVSSGTYNLVLDQNRKVTNLTLSSKTIDLNGYSLTVHGVATMTSGTVTNGDFIAVGSLASFNGTLMDCIVDANCGYIRLSGSTFNEVADFTDQGLATGNGTGGCTFNDDVTITHNGTLTYFNLGGTSGDVFNGNVTFTNNSNRELNIAINSNTTFNGNVILNSTSTGGILIGNSSGSATLASGKTISIGGSGFAADYLTLRNFTQSGSTAQTLTLTSTAIVNMISCTFNGNLTVSSPGFLLKNSTFNGTSSFTRTATSGNYQSDGGNTFNGSVTVDNSGSSGRIRMATTTPDVYNGNATFNSSGGWDVQIAYSGDNLFAGDITINSNKVVFNTASGKVTFTGGNSQTLNGSYNFPFKKLAINKSANHVTANTTLSVDDTLFFISKNLITTSTNLLTMKHGSTAIGASNSSFVSGPVKKTGNSAFQFPVGKGNYFGPLEISASTNSSDAYKAEYFDTPQNLGDSIEAGNTNLSPVNYWNLSKLTGNSSVAIKLTWNNSLYDYGNDSTLMNIVYWNDTIWKGLLGCTASRINENILLSSSYSTSSFGFFTIANGGYGGFNSGFISTTTNSVIFGKATLGQHGDCNGTNELPTYTLYNQTQSPTFCVSGTTPVLQDLVDLSVGYNHSLAVLCDNTVVSWGDNNYLQLGNYTFSSTNNFSAIHVVDGNNQPLANIVKVYAGKAFSLAIDKSGQVYYWGQQLSSMVNCFSPQVGNGNPIPSLLKYMNGQPLENIISVAAGTNHILLLRNDGLVFSIGCNQFNSLGNPNYTNSNNAIPVLSSTPPYDPIENVREIAASQMSSIALAGNQVLGWGSIIGGFLNNNYASPLSGLSSVRSIGAGSDHVMCLTSANGILAFGSNSYNQCGSNPASTLQSTTTTSTPTLVALPTNPSEIYKVIGSERHSLAFAEDGTIYGWGENKDFQLAVLQSAPTIICDLALAQWCVTEPIEISNSQNGSVIVDELLVPCDYEINYCYYDLEVNSSIDWQTTNYPDCYLNHQILIENELLIKKGVVLEILNGIDLIFGPNGRIVLEEGDATDDGAQLILNSGSTLTAAGDCMWKGIEVRGNSAFTAGDSRQAKVIINSGAIIKHAHNAVTLGKWDEGYYACYESQPIVHPSGFDLTGSGGQIECDDATFQNNAIDIRFASYTKLSASVIENTHFLGGTLRDARYLSSSFNPFYASSNSAQRASNSIRQWQTFIVNIEGNDFKNYEEALKLTDSRLRIISNSFEDCGIGINTNSTMSVLIYGGQVQANTFKNVRTQINAAGGKYLNIFGGNNFNTLVSPGTQSTNQRGIFLNNERSFTILDNNFTSLRYAIVSINSSFSGGAIKYADGPDGNIFTNCWRSIHLQGDNSRLQIGCNQYDNNLGGSSYYSNWVLSSGTLANQGIASYDYKNVQAGNWFIQALNRNQITSFSSNSFTYFLQGLGSANELIPTSNGTGIINVDANSIIASSFSEACSPIIIPPNGEPDRLSYFNNLLDSLNLEMDTLLSSIDNQITDSLVVFISDVNPQDTILDRLRSNGPLSDTVLIKAINTIEALNDTALYEVLFVNSPLSSGDMHCLNNRDPEMDEGLRDALNLVQGSNPPFITITSLNIELDYYQTEKRLLINSYVNRLSSEDSVQKAIQVLEFENTGDDQQTIFGTYITQNEFDSASVKLESLIDAGVAEADWLAISEILLSLASEDRTWFDMSEEDRDVLREIANQEANTVAKIQAQNVMHLVYGDTFPVIIDEEEIYLRQIKQQEDQFGITIDNELQLYPNPANDFVEIRSNKSNEPFEQIILLNSLGKVVLHQKINEKENSYILNITNLPSGLYLIKINGAGTKTYSSKLMIAR